jgi:4-hydroxy-tetrahydrodipicolinate synthase
MLVEDSIWSASPTPFFADGSLDESGLERLVEQHAGLGVRGLFLGGTCGEGPFMPNAQRAELVRMIRRIGGRELHLAVQVSDTSAVRVRENMAQAVDAGADSVVIAAPWLRPFVNRPFARRYFFDALAAPCAAPIGIYILPQPPETGIDLELWSEVVQHPRVKFVKDSLNTNDSHRMLLSVKSRRSDLTIRTGYEFDVLAPLQAGYDGCLLGTAILTGGLIARAVQALRSGDAASARSWQERSNRLLYDLFRPDLSVWLGGLKYALCRLGIFTTEYSHLSYPLTDDDRQRIDAALARERDYLHGV